MNKGELVDAVAKDAKISKAEAQAAVDSVVNSVTKALKKGQKVTLVGFGTFKVDKRKATGSIIREQSAANYAAVFRLFRIVL